MHAKFLSPAVAFALVACGTAPTTPMADSHSVPVATSSVAPGNGVIHLTGAGAEDFIRTHFPEAEIPGRVVGKFEALGHAKAGAARCYVPAMGERSDGAESTCDITPDRTAGGSQ